MKRVFMLLMCLLAMMAASLSAKAQEITIYLLPGWTWISYPRAEAMNIADALGDFVPHEGDIIKSQYANAMYQNGGWRGRLQELTPGLGYHYYNSKGNPVTLVFSATIPQPQVLVTTSEPLLVTAISAMGGGEVTTTDGTYIIVKGLCWATHENPTTNDDFYQEAESGVGNFSISMTGLNIGTTYYVRAYAVTPNGTVYGDQKSFTTRDGIPTVTTAEVANIGVFSAICGGNVLDDGGLTVTRGVCWSTTSNPTVSDSHTSDDSGLGNFSSYMGGLNHSTTYYVRAYSTTNHVTTYGEEVCFTTLDLPEGAIDGRFSVSASQQVCFSQGNLQYIGSATMPYWKFADNQWDVLGTTTGQNSTDQNVDRDLFGWGTSGYNHGANCYQPWSTSGSYSDYYAYGSYTYNLYDQTGQADWGYNSISNGGNQSNQWRTLTTNEWAYVFNTRITSSGIRYAKANVNNVNGVILLPDNWSTSYFTLSNTNSTDANLGSNTISASQWDILEQHGAVFLPAAGCRDGASVYGMGIGGYYRSASYVNSYSAYSVYFDDSNLGPMNYFYRSYGFSVRLARIAE